MSEFSMNSISDSLRRTIEDIKEITGQHSDEDIYEMLKDCNMDPNETAQKLLYLDTFHEVKRKRDRRKVRRGGGNQSSSYKSAGGGGRRLNPRREDRSTVRDSKSSSAVHHKESNKAPPNTVSSTSVSNGSSIADQNIKGVVAKDTNYDDISKRLPSLRHVSLKHLPHIDPGPTPTSTPTNIATPARDNKTQGGDLKPKSSLVGNSVGLYSSSTDPVLVPSLNPRNGSVGIIKRETGNQHNSAEISSNTLEDKTDAGQNVVFGQVVGCLDLSSNTRPVENQGVESNPAEPSHHTGGENGDKETCLAQEEKAPSKAEMSEVASEANQHSLPIKDPISEQSTSETDIKQHKQQTTVRESVIFPNYLHVPEGFKNSFTFGSLEASTGSIDSSHGDASIGGTNAETSKEPPMVPQSSSSSDVVVDIKPAQENASSNTPMRYDQSQQEMQQSVGGVSLNRPTPPSMPDYGLNFIPPVVGPHPMQLEGIETQVGNAVAPSSSTPSTAQPRGVSPSSMAMPPPQMFPYLRQTYPPNYIPYNPYFSHLYMPPPQNTHQLLSHPPSASSMYMPPPATSTGIKFQVPPVYKPGNVAPNMSHYGYGSYGPNYGPSGGAPPFSNDDIGGGEIKDKNTYSTVQQNEDLHAFANGRDPSTLQTNIMYNLPQAQAMAFQNSYSGLYHPSQAMPTRSLVQPVHQAQPTGSPLEPTSPPQLATYSQPQPQPQLLPQYGQMNWNQKFLNRENV